ncbi:MAG TPA: methyltransferase domain-containing protein [Solirubrobacteraceae bacterium]|jgi:SAM-dependent methyltransferase|nr:methyltransferase domain-containing protein [Solirubrobacteraceae bacterium]
MSDIWNGAAPGWEANARFVDGQLALATETLLDAAGIREGSAVLDLAAGPGGAGLAAAERVGPSGTVVLSDVAAEMVAVAARQAAAYSNVSTAVFDQREIAAEDGHFDAAISRHGLMFAEDPSGAVREAARVLRSGGRYAAMTWGPRELNPWLGLILDAVGEQFGVPFPPPGVAGPFSLGDGAVLTSVLQDGGLLDVQVEIVATPMHAASLDAWWERVPKLAGPLAIALAAMEPDVRDAIAKRALCSGANASRREGDQIVFAGSVLIGSGHTPPAP